MDVESNERLDKSDAEYVECIHTGDNCFGINQPLCTANFYLNGGSGQPGCGGEKFGEIFSEFSCNFLLK